MSPLIHFLIKQPALCLSHGLYLSSRTAEPAGQVTCMSRLIAVDRPPTPNIPTPLRLDRNNKQSMIHDGDREVGRWW